MNPWLELDGVTVYAGDCRTVMADLPPCSVDAVVTDPPYELAFMGKGWDASGIAYDNHVWDQVHRVLKPGGHLLAFGGTRTWHRLAVAIEDAGFEVRDSVAWMYASGFPKSLDVSKAIDKKRDDRADVLRVTSEIARLRDIAGLSNRDLDDAFGFAGMAGHWTSTKSQPTVPRVEQWAVLRDMLNPDEWLDDEVWRLNGRKGKPGEAWEQREVIGERSVPLGHSFAGQTYRGDDVGEVDYKDTAPATPAAQQWQGWGTALKPAFEPIVVARKPLIGTVAENVLAHGTGALNIDGCRIAGDVPSVPQPQFSRNLVAGFGASEGRNGDMSAATAGRWPANVILDESQALALDAQSGVLTSAAPNRNAHYGTHEDTGSNVILGRGLSSATPNQPPYGDTGGASRFFYVPKANASERPRDGDTAHPTVKPLDLMRYLVKLVTPPGGTVLEPFAGSGTTLEACIVEGFNVIGIELTLEYLELIRKRVTKPIEPVLL